MEDSDELAAVRALVADGKDEAALQQLRARMRWPTGKQLSELGSWLAILADLCEKRGALALAQVAREAVRDPDSPDRLYALGYALIDFGAPAIAASVLWHCLALVGDSEEVVTELVSALESALAYGDAYAILEQHTALRTRSFLCEYLFAFNAAMSGKLDVTRAAFANLQPDSDETARMRETISLVLARADQVASVTSLDAEDLRGWQYVLTGTLLAHRSPFGYEEGMTGRYAWLQDSVAAIATGITRLAPLVRATGASCVYAPPGRDHEILARAFATRLELPFVPWPNLGVPAPGLVVCYDLADVPPTELTRLAQRKPDQIFYAHASPWTHDSPIAPDVTSMLYESIVPPWGEKVVVEGGGPGDTRTPNVYREPADERESAAIAADILASPGLSDSDTASDDLAGWHALVAATWPLGPGPRSRMWAGGPVSSNRFN
jgi:hypothetical protein